MLDWEKYYYENELLQREYNVDNDKVKQYFEVNNVIDGFFTISQLLFGIKYREVEDPSVWDDEVLMYEMLEQSTGEIIGVFYICYPVSYSFICCILQCFATRIHRSNFSSQ